MKMKRGIAILLATVLSASLWPGTVRAEKEEQEVSILFTHDLHSHLDVTYEETGELGGVWKAEDLYRRKTEGK